jgi:hypothetical protein
MNGPIVDSEAESDLPRIGMLRSLRSPLWVAKGKSRIFGPYDISEDGTLVSLKRMPRNVNLWLRLGKSFSLLHPTSLIRRSALTKLGGFDGTTRIAADTDFLLRAAPLLKIVNAPGFLYHYRIRQDSLTGDAATGHGSAPRRNYLDAMRQHVKQGRRNQSFLAPPNDTEFRLSPVRF